MTKMNNKGFLLAESLIVSTFVLTVLIFLFIQFRSIMISNKRTYTYNSIEDIYSLGSVSDYYKNNPDVLDNLKGQINESNKYIYIYKDNETNPLCSGTCHRIAEAGALEYIIYTDSNIETIREALNNDQAAEDLRTFVRKIDTQMVEGMGRLIGKYKNGNFATVVLNTNIKNRKPIIKSWGPDDQTDFHATTYRDKITKVFFEDKISLKDAVASWDVSANPNEPVIAWVTRENAYAANLHLHIGGKGGVTANADSSNLFRFFPVLNEIAFNNNFDTSNAVNMSHMFAGGNAMESIDVSSFDTSNVTNMTAMFSAYDSRASAWAPDERRKLKTITGVGTFNTSNVTSMRDMFAGQQFTAINLSSYDTSNVTDMFHMFNGCNKVVSIDISNWDTSKVTDMRSMFCNCTELKKIYADSKFVTTKVTLSDAMFTGSKKIVGGNGTTFDSNKIDKEYARIDGTSKGYFTKIEDKSIPIGNLLLWGEAQNPLNTTSILKNKITGDNITITGFNNTTASGYNGTGINRDLVFDGSNDYIYTGMEKKNFGEHMSFVIYADVSTTPATTYHIIGDWEGSGSGMYKNTANNYGYQVYQNSSSSFVSALSADDETKYDLIVGTYDGSNVKLYLNGVLKSTKAFTKPMKVSTVRLVIGANPGPNNAVSYFAKMRLKEVLIYQRALTANEITKINTYMKTKYQQ